MESNGVSSFLESFKNTIIASEKQDEVKTYDFEAEYGAEIDRSMLRLEAKNGRL